MHSFFQGSKEQLTAKTFAENSASMIIINSFILFSQEMCSEVLKARNMPTMISYYYEDLMRGEVRFELVSKEIGIDKAVKLRHH